MGKLYFIIGNGFTIDLLSNCDVKIREQIDVVNLFRNGDQVLWPKANRPEFLSYKRTPNLWTLGARPNLDKETALGIIEDIITCSNVYHSSNRVVDVNDLNIYIKAYTELTMYLKYLFIHYNTKVSDEYLKKQSELFPFIKFLKRRIDYYDEIIIITYNYDIFLERMLKLNDLDFVIVGKGSKKSKIKIHKPHGSISFTYKIQIPSSGMFQINPDTVLNTDINLREFRTVYVKLESDLSTVNAIIPPAGDSRKYNFKWSQTIQNNIISDIKKSEENDEVIVYGLSYWHVDRNELDDILTNFEPKIDMRLINPSPPSTFTAVLTSLFENLTIHNSSKILEVNNG